MRRSFCTMILLAVTASSLAADAVGGVVTGAGAAHASVNTHEHLDLAVERDFSGTYAVSTWIQGDDALALYLDCVWVQQGSQPGTGEVAASGVVLGANLPVLRPISVRIVAAGGASRIGVADGVRGTGPDCGRTAVTTRPASAAAVVFASA